MILASGIKTVYVPVVDYDDEGNKIERKRKMHIGEIVRGDDKWRTVITVVTRQGELLFTKHHQHFQATSEIIENGEIIPDPRSMKWVDRSKQSLNIPKLCELLLSWTNQDEDAAMELYERATNFALAAL